MARIHPGDSYLTGVLPALVVFGIGLAALITPITATVLASVDARHSGIASAVNNAVSRLGQMIAVAVLPLAAGLSGADFTDPAKMAAGFPVAMTIAAGTSFAAALLAWTTISDDVLSQPSADTEPVAAEAPALCSATLRSGRDPAGHVTQSTAQFPPTDSQVIALRCAESALGSGRWALAEVETLTWGVRVDLDRWPGSHSVCRGGT